MRNADTTRRGVLGGLAGAAVLGGIGTARAQTGKLPGSPLTFNIIDAAGNLALTQRGFDDFRKQNPKLVSRFVFSQAPSPELPGKIKAEQDANHLDIDMVLIGTDALSAGIELGLWEPIFPAHASALPDLKQILLPAAWNMQSLAQNQGVIVTYYPSGPLFEYAPD